MCNLSEYVMEYAESRGMERGMERKTAELVAENLGRGASYEDIARFLGLTVAEVKEIEGKAFTPA